jgi:MFS transporter, PPP family, 3-phenylpropionic acid transporter
VASFGAGALLDLMAPVDLIWLMVAAMAIATGAALALVPLGVEPAGGLPNRASAAHLLRNPAFLAAIAAASLVQASHAVYYGFSTLDWQAAGYDGGVIGALWALGVIAEIALFALSARLPSTISPLALLLVGAVGAAVRWSAMAIAPPAILLPALQCLHAFSFGTTHLGALAFVSRMAPPGAGATAQGYFAVALGATMAAATALAGVLYGRFGSGAYAAMAVLAVAGGLCALAASRAQRSLSHQ